MAPPVPPATPTPHRFLVPKRSQQQLRPRNDDTPKPTPSTALHGMVGPGAPPSSSSRGPQQFQATPRFSTTPRATLRRGLPSSSARLSTPGATAFRASGRSAAELLVDLESSEPEDAGRGEDEDAVVGESPPLFRHVDENMREPAWRERVYDDDDHNGHEAVKDYEKRYHKRRRISPLLSSFSPGSPTSRTRGYETAEAQFDVADEDQEMIQEVEGTDMHDLDGAERALNIESSLLDGTQQRPTAATAAVDDQEITGGGETVSSFDQSEEERGYEHGYGYEEEDAEHIATAAVPPHHSSPTRSTRTATSALNQPRFQRAPRFRPIEPPAEGRPEPLPDAFSPARRKGANKYLPGGLAAELRDWLVDVEAGSSSTMSTASYAGIGVGSGRRFVTESAREREPWVTRVRVDEITGGHGCARGMTLVLGRLLVRGGEDGGEETLAANTTRIVLAGQGRLTGLGVGNVVRPGVVLGIARPTWEIFLDGLGRWGVACDWVVLR